MIIYTVQPGDTLETIASAYGTTVESIAFINQLLPPYPLVLGQPLLLEGGSPSFPRPEAVSFGYAYPYIRPWILEQTLPFLTDLYIFSYGFSEQGYLIPPPLDETWMIEAAVRYNVNPVLTLTPLGEDGRFNNTLISSVVQNPLYRETLIRQLLETMEEKGYNGVDVDFEYIRAFDRDGFSDFLQTLANALHAYGYTVSVALAPKTSSDQIGLLYEGKDYGALGAAADSVLLMTYEWGYKYHQ